MVITASSPRPAGPRALAKIGEVTNARMVISAFAPVRRQTTDANGIRTFTPFSPGSGRGDAGERLK